MKKKRKEEKVKIIPDESNEIIRFAKVLGIVIVLILALYLFTGIFITKDLFNKKDNKDAGEVKEVDFNYEVTVLGSLLNRPYDEYYVIVFNSDDKQENTYMSIVDDYENPVKIYFADLNSPFNSIFYDKDNSNPKATTVEDIKVGDLTLIKVKDSKIVKYLEDVESIKKELK